MGGRSGTGVLAADIPNERRPATANRLTRPIAHGSLKEALVVRLLNFGGSK